MILRRLSLPLSLSLSTAALAMAGLLASAPATAADNGEPGKVTSAAARAIGAVRLDADMKAVLAAQAALHPKAMEKLTPFEARQQPGIADAVAAVLQQQHRSTDPAVLLAGITAQDVTLQGPAGLLPARVYTPDGPGPFPVVVYFHGGGWVIADKQAYDASARGIAQAANAVVVSVDYRQAPENKFPAAWDDAFSAYKFVAQHAAELKGDPSRLALAGESAGGNLAVATALAARDANVTKPLHVLAIYPVAQTSLNTPSYIENAIARPLNRAMMRWFLAQATSAPDDLQDPRLDLVKADLHGLPPVTIINARVDPLRSDGAQLATALRKAGVQVERKVYPGVTHEFFAAAAVVAKAVQAQAYAGQRLKGAFGH